MAMNGCVIATCRNSCNVAYILLSGNVVTEQNFISLVCSITHLKEELTVTLQSKISGIKIFREL